jgi:hypothetical protein
VAALPLRVAGRCWCWRAHSGGARDGSGRTILWVPKITSGAVTWGFVLAGAARCGHREDPRVARFYRLVQLVIDLLVLRGRTDRCKDVEIVVLRHQLAVLQRQISRPRFAPEDRAILSAFARALGRDRWSMFLVQPATILRWHRRLVAGHWTCGCRKCVRVG